MRCVCRRIAACSILAWAVAGYATPSTQIWIPSTDVQPFLSPHLGWDVYLNAFGGGLVSNGGVTIGVLPAKKIGLEVGIDYRDISGDHLDPLYFNAKCGVPEGAFFPHMPAIAVGGYDFGTKKNVTTYNILYGLIAKNIWKAGRLSVGAYKGAVGADAGALFAAASEPEKIDDVGLLVSWDRTLAEISDKLWTAIDFQSGRSGYGAVSFGFAWNFAPNAGVIVGYNVYLDREAIKPTVTIQWDANLW